MVTSMASAFLLMRLSTVAPGLARVGIGLWLDCVSSERYRDMGKVMITADCGGCNDPRLRLWKVDLQWLADETGVVFQVCHYPPVTSK